MDLKLDIPSQASSGLAPDGSYAHLTKEHCELLREISSPWSEAFRMLAVGKLTRARVENAVRRAFRGITIVQLAEFDYVTTRPAAVSRAMLANGRGEFSAAASDVLSRKLSQKAIACIVANDGALLLPVVVDNVLRSF
jgi:hypothetical protein